MKLDRRDRDVLRLLEHAPLTLARVSTFAVDRLLARRLIVMTVVEGRSLYALTPKGRAELVVRDLEVSR